MSLISWFGQRVTAMCSCSNSAVNRTWANSRAGRLLLRYLFRPAVPEVDLPDSIVKVGGFLNEKKLNDNFRCKRSLIAYNNNSH